MGEFRISVDLSAVAVAAGNIVNETVFPMLAQAVRAVSQQTAANWAEAVQRAKLWSGERDQYAGSIKVKETGPFAATVYTDYRHAQAIEKGRPARDLKRYLDTSAKTRRSAKGNRYLIIPFRHSTPGSDGHAPAMPTDVYEVARELTPSRVTGSGRRASGLMASDPKTRGPLTVNQNQYKWGGRLPAGLAPKLRPGHKSDPFAGMYRFDTTTPGGRRYSTFLTFRVLSERSSGWVIPPQPGLNIAQQVVQQMQPLAEKVFREAMRRTV